MSSRRSLRPHRDGPPPALLTPGEAPLAALATAGSDAPLLVVDQFEEVFGPAVDEDERAAFIRELCALATPVVIALRADFYGRALEYAELARAAQEAQVVVGPMDDTDLRCAVVEPARKAGVTIEDGLVEVLLADVHRPGSESGAAGLLPLLSHALLATWRRGEGVRMTVADYHAVGGIAGGVAQSAEEAFTQLPADRQELVRRIFLRLVHVAPDLADTRRRVERAELPGGGEVGEVGEVLDLFVARRLLTVDEHAVEITHEALLTAWPRLRSWIDADRAGLAAHRRLTEAARAWRDAGRDPDLLLRGGRLAAAQELTTQATGELNDVERAFLDAATARDDAERHAERRRTRRLRRLLAVLAVALLVAAGTGAYAVQQRGDMARERDLAVSRQVAARSDVLRAKDPSVAAQLAVAAYRIAPTAEARATLLDATGSPTPARLPGPPGTTQSVAGNAARGLLVTSAGNGPTAQVWARSDRGWQRLADTPPVGGRRGAHRGADAGRPPARRGCRERRAPVRPHRSGAPGRDRRADRHAGHGDGCGVHARRPHARRRRSRPHGALVGRRRPRPPRSRGRVHRRGGRAAGRRGRPGRPSARGRRRRRHHLPVELR